MTLNSFTDFSLPVLSDCEIAIGQPVGSVPLPAPPERVEPDPVRALRDALLPALLRPPCVVAFSGGRDSSLLLATAADLAAREGLEPPVALTFRYPDDEAADESWWQDLVIAQLHDEGLKLDWMCRDVAGELDNLGPLTAPVLRAHGSPTYPPGLGNTILLAQYARGGSLVTGNAGDEVVGGHRAGTLRAVLRRRGRGLAPSDWRQVGLCVAPAAVRTRYAERQTGPLPWLRPDVRRAALAEMAMLATRPLRWDRSVWSALAPRAVHIGRETRSAITAEQDCALVEPLGEVPFVASYAAVGGRWRGFTRTEGTRLLAGGLLPDALLKRGQKASFNASRFGAVSREFASNWDGRGVDEELVDPEALRDAWLADEPPAPTAMLLQQAWLVCR